MKKKVVLGIFSGMIFLTALLLIILFSAPIFYNTKYEVIDNNRLLVGTMEFNKDGTVTMIGNEDTGFDTDSTQKYLISNGQIYLLDNSSSGLLIPNDTLQIKNKFSIVSNDCSLTPCGGGGVIAFLLLVTTNIASIIVVISVALSYYIKRKNAKQRLVKSNSINN